MISIISLSKFTSFIIENGKRILKVKQYGAKTAKESYPFGFDSVPPEGWTAIFAETANKDEAVIIGYINRNQIASMGDSRMYALGANKEVTAFAWARSGGNLELNGSGFSAVRFAPLDSALQSEKTAINAEFIKIQAAIAAIGGSYIISPITVNISNSESATVKVK
jgi:hypothetical protein